MKVTRSYIIVLCLCLLSGFTSTPLKAQNDEAKFSFEGSHGKSILGNSSLRIFLFEAGINTFLYNGSANLPHEIYGESNYYIDDFDLDYGRSFNFNFHAYSQRIGFGKGHLSIRHGLYFELSNFSFEKDIILGASESELVVTRDTLEHKKNRLQTGALNLPLMIQFRSNPNRPNRSLNLGIGAYGGLLMFSKARQKTELYGNQRTKDDFNLNKFKWGLRGTLGFGPINFYVTYSLSNLFREGEAPEFRQLNAGLIFIPF